MTTMMDYTDLHHFRAEYAKPMTMCDRCENLIEEGELCILKGVKAPYLDMMTSPSFHLDCFFVTSRSTVRPTRVGEIGCFESLREEDQEKIRTKLKQVATSSIVMENISTTIPINILNDGNDSTDTQKDDKKVPASKLEIPVQNLLKKIFYSKPKVLPGFRYQIQNLPVPDFMLKLDTMPWGKLCHQVILEACEILKDVMTLLDENVKQLEIISSTALDDLQHRYDLYISQNFGPDFSGPLTNHDDTLFKVKLRVLKFFLDSQLGYLLLIDVDKTDERQRAPSILDSKYINLQCHITTLDPNDNMRSIITNYFKMTYTSRSIGHSPGYELDLELENIFEVERYDEEKRFEPYKNWDNRKILWHASILPNFVGILSTGLRMSQARAFGKGIYFSDAVDKSLSYVNCGSPGDTMVLLLCEVALGDEYRLNDRTNNELSEIIRYGKNSIKCVGINYPDPSGDLKMLNGAVIPGGKLISSQEMISSFEHNQYIILDESQCILRYLVQLKTIKFGSRAPENSPFRVFTNDTLALHVQPISK